MSNEITVRITCSLQEIYNILNSKGFSIVDKYNLEDTYYILNNIDIREQPIRGRQILQTLIFFEKLKVGYTVNKLEKITRKFFKKKERFTVNQTKFNYEEELSKCRSMQDITGENGLVQKIIVNSKF